MERTLERDGCELLRGATPVASLERLGAEAASLLARIERISHRHGPWGAAEQLAAEGVQYLPTADSFNLGALCRGPWHPRALSDAAVDRIEASLGGPAALDLNLCFVRRQFPECCRPAGQAPHGWHQDGACGHDFLQGDPGQGLVPMVTAWIPMQACGEHAPGLELLEGRGERLWTVAELQAPVGQGACWRPPMVPGDVMLMLGDKVHRTHVSQSMSAQRACVELRFVSAARVPARFSAHTHVPLKRGADCAVSPFAIDA